MRAQQISILQRFHNNFIPPFPSWLRVNALSEAPGSPPKNPCLKEDWQCTNPWLTWNVDWSVPALPEPKRVAAIEAAALRGLGNVDCLLVPSVPLMPPLCVQGKHVKVGPCTCYA